MEAVTGYSDWEFLRPSTTADSGVNEPTTATVQDSSAEKKRKNTSLEDFDGELAVFQVQLMSSNGTFSC